MADFARPGLQIVGSAVGFVVGGPLGASIGASIGGELGKALFPVNVGEGPRINEAKLNTSTYGTPIPVAYGPLNRLAGNIIWKSALRTEEDEVEVSKGNEVTEITQTIDVAIMICEGEQANIDEVWANGELLWSSDYFQEDVDQAQAEYDAADTNATLLEAEAASCGLSSDPDCSLLYSIAAAARAQADAAYARLTAAQAAQTEYETGTSPWTFTSSLALGATFRFYPGTFTQPVDPTIEAARGAGNAPAYRGVCYVMIENLNVTAFNGFPNFEFQVRGKLTTLRQILGDIHARSGNLTTDYSVSNLLDDTVDGYFITRQMSSLAAITQLEQAFAFDSVEQRGQIRHVKRGGHNKATIDEGDAGARSGRDYTPRQPIKTTRANDEALPRVATVTYRDASRDFQPNSQRATRVLGNSQNIINLELGITLSNAKARELADRLLWEPWTGRTTVEIDLLPKFDFLSPADVIGIPVAGAVVPFRIESMATGNDGIIKIKARQDDPFVYAGSQDFQAAAIEEPAGLAFDASIAFVYNAPILAALEPDTGFSWAIGSAGDNWPGGGLYRSLDYSEWDLAKFALTRNVLGTVTAATPAGNQSGWDTVTTIDVLMDYHSATLTTRTDEEILNGKNAFWLGDAEGVGGEIIQFVTATLISTDPKVYRLSRLLRGRRATEHEIGAHGTNERFVLIRETDYRYADFGVADWNLERYYRGVTSGKSVDEVVTTQEFANTAEKAKPRAPALPQVERDASDNLTITWQRRIRGIPQGGTTQQPLDETTEQYEIDIYDGASVVGTYSATSPELSYTAGQQSADGLTPGDPVTGIIYQMSDRVGRGYGRTFTG